jgi:tetratricopeptide (TPR) repeat protein
MAKRLTRKKLKQKDEFITTAERFLNAVSTHKTGFVVGAITLLFLLIFGSIGYYYYKDYSKRGSIAYSQALQLYDIALKTQDKKDITNAMNEFETVETNFKFLNISKFALLYVGSCEYLLGDYDKAIQTYKTFLSRWGKDNNYIASIAYNGEIESYIAKNDCNKALSLIDEIINLKDNPFLELTYVHAVYCYLTMHQPEKALVFLENEKKNNINNKDLVLKITNLIDYVKQSSNNKIINFKSNNF